MSYTSPAEQLPDGYLQRLRTALPEVEALIIYEEGGTTSVYPFVCWYDALEEVADLLAFDEELNPRNLWIWAL